MNLKDFCWKFRIGFSKNNFTNFKLRDLFEQEKDWEDMYESIDFSGHELREFDSSLK